MPLHCVGYYHTFERIVKICNLHNIVLPLCPRMPTSDASRFKVDSTVRLMYILLGKRENIVAPSVTKRPMETFRFTLSTKTIDTTI